MNMSPRPIAITMNMMTVMSIQMIPVISMSVPVIRGETADMMRTCATSSMTVMKIRVSTSAWLIRSCSARTMVTTAVEEPEMMAPKMID